MSFVVSDVSNAIGEAHAFGLSVRMKKEANGDRVVLVWDWAGNSHEEKIPAQVMMTAKNTDFLVAERIRLGIEALSPAPQESLQEYLDRMDGYDIDRECGDR